MSAAWRARTGDPEVTCTESAVSHAGRVGMEILVDSPAFMARLEEDLRCATVRVAVQTMSFEGDSAGNRLAAALIACPAPVKRLLVDSYSRFVISDKCLLFPAHWRNRELRRETRDTRRTLADLGEKGIAVGLTNPMDPLLIRFMARNHKKLIVIDRRIAYLGGINFCDHNFAWHDMMVRIDDEEVAGFLWDDFQATWGGRNLCARRHFGNLWLATLDGRHNEEMLSPVRGAIEEARRRIVIVSGYVTFPFFRWLRAAHARGVEVVLLTPETNNKPIVRDYLLWEATRAGFAIRLYPGRMSHLKAMLIDDAALVTGSSNFDYISHTVQQELVAMITDPAVIAEYSAQVLAPDLLRAKPFNGRVSAIGGWLRFAAMKTVGSAMTAMIRALDAIAGAPKPERSEAWAA